MTEDELKKLLDGEDLLKKLDVKSLVIDHFMRNSTIEEAMEIFYKKLPLLEESYVRRFIYMKRA